jgi:hypothetical protein
MTLHEPQVKVSDEAEGWPTFDPAQATLYEQAHVMVLESLTHTVLPRFAARRRATIMDVLDSFESVTVYRARMMTDAQGDACWDAVCRLRGAIVAALERCESRERAARWVRDE